MSTRSKLESIGSNLDDSMGLRANAVVPQLSPVPSPKDIGVTALRGFGALSLDKVIPDPEQPRVEFDDDAIAQLAQSIQEQGQLHPIHVRWSDEHESWLIISGERRFRAAKHAGLPTIDCYFHEGKLCKTEILEQQLIENLLRSDLRPMEEAKAFQQLIHLNDWTGKELAKALRIHASKVTRSLALLKLPEDVQQLVETAKLTPTVAYELSKLSSPEQQRGALRKHQSEPVTVNQVSRQVRKRRGVSGIRNRGRKQVFLTESGCRITVMLARKGNYHEMEQALREALEEVQLRIDNNVVLT